MAGTGGTSSSSWSPAALCTFLGFGVGNRDVERRWLALGCRVVFDARRELKLELDDRDRPECRDLRLVSGVLRADDGVILLRKSMAGERLAALASDTVSGRGRSGIDAEGV